VSSPRPHRSRALLFVGALALALAGVGGYALLGARGADDLRDGARIAERFDNRRGPTRRLPAAGELDALGPFARRVVQVECYESGGDVMRQYNCFGGAAEHMRYLATERDERRSFGLVMLGLGAALLLGALALTHLSRRAERRMKAALGEPPPGAAP
jgi:hypothetical protein